MTGRKGYVMKYGKTLASPGFWTSPTLIKLIGMWGWWELRCATFRGRRPRLMGDVPLVRGNPRHSFILVLVLEMGLDIALSGLAVHGVCRVPWAAPG